MPEERPKANVSSDMKSQRLKVINIKLMELMKKPRIIKVFSTNWGKVIIGMIVSED